MQVVLLAGGLGTRLSEETQSRPKPMVEIGGWPMLWHIMHIYYRHGLSDFLVALGYRGDFIKNYFSNYCMIRQDLHISLKNGQTQVQGGSVENWELKLIDTGLNTQTGGRLKRLGKHLTRGTFMMTYGDGVSDVDITKLLAFHKRHGKLATVTAVRPPARFGGLRFDGDMVVEFVEKPQIGEGWINGGFFVLEPQVLDYIDGDDMPFERDPMERLARDGQLAAYKHDGFWQCMDTLRDLRLLETLWQSGQAPWMKVPHE